MRDKGGLRIKRRGIMAGSEPVGKAGADANGEEEVGRLVDTLYALTRAIAAASASVEALRALKSGGPKSCMH